MSKPTVFHLSEIPISQISGRYFLVRVNFDDTHFDLNGKIDDIRMHLAKPTIETLSNNGGKIILFNHLGRPQGIFQKELQTDLITNAFSKLLNKHIRKIDGEFDKNEVFKLVGNQAKQAVVNMRPGDIIMLENTRFDARETSKSGKSRTELAQEIVNLALEEAPIFVIDGFPITHRDNTATVTEIAKLTSGIKGFWQEKEEAIHSDFLKVLKTRNSGDRLTAIFGGNKADKQHEISQFAKLFLKEKDHLILAGKYPEELLDNKTSELLKNRGVHIITPSDVIGDGKDIGPQTLTQIKKILDQSDILFWEGPVGKFEEAPFHEGGFAIINHIAGVKNQKNGKLKWVFLSGGELGWMTKLALNWTNEHIGSIEGFTISSGGGASIAFFATEGKMHGVKNLKGWEIDEN